MPAKRKGGDNTSETSAQETNETTSMVVDQAATTKTSKRAKKEPVEPVVEPAPQKVGERTTRNKSQSSSNIGLNQYLEDLFDVVCSYQDDTQRYLANIFYVLPSASKYPDYYEVIKKPIDLREVAKRILNSQYTSLAEMESDLMLMMDNAKRYNDPKSFIYKDANKLKGVIRTTAKELGSLLRANKPFQSAKSHEKKMKLLEDIAEMETDADTASRIVVTEQAPTKTEPANTTLDDTHEEEAESEDEDEEDEESDGGEDDVNKSGDSETHGTKKGGAAQQPLITAMWSLFDYLKDLRYANQTIIDPFVKLPSKRAYPDYYEEIKKPIALSIIKTKLNKRRYATMNDLVADLELLFANAMQYNVEESLIYANAKRLLEAMKTKKSEFGTDIMSARIPVRGPKSPGGAKRGPKPNTPNKVTKSGINMLDHNLKRLYKLLVDYCEEDKPKNQIDKKIPGGRASKLVVPLSQHFMTLPKRETNPEFYEKVKDPMDLTMVKDKIDSSEYKSELEMFNDCVSIFQNAKLVYNETTQIHQDAIKLQAYLTNRYQTLTNQRNQKSTSDLLAETTSTTAIKTKTAPHQQKPVVIPKFSDVKEKLVYLYNYINDFQIDGRDLAHPFRHLPSRTEYPDYYNIIRKPIDMTKIWHKLNQYGYTSSYVTMDDMCADFAQMFENACTYNEPGSMIYKDALNMQRALFTRRDEVLASELAAAAAVTGHANDDFSQHESLPVEFVAGQVQEIIESLFEACMGYQDAEGRSLVDSFVEFAYLDELPGATGDSSVITFEIIRQRIKDRVYKRLDAFQDEMFELFTHTRTRSYFDARKPTNNKIHRFSQLYRDAYELQRYFMQKRDELCRNGELLNSPALSYKPHALDTHIASVVGTSDPSFDENEALLVEERYRPLEKTLSISGTTQTGEFRVGNYYLLSRELVRSGLSNHEAAKSTRNEPIVVCVLALDKTHLVGQLYLKPSDDEFIDPQLVKLRKTFDREVLKTDLYTKIEIKKAENELVNCLVVGIRQFVTFDPNFEPVKTEDTEEPEPSVHIKPESIFICESYYSTVIRYFRKLGTKKWSPLGCLNSSPPEPPTYNFTFTKRANVYNLDRSYKDPAYIEELTRRFDARMKPAYEHKAPTRAYFRETVQFDTLPPLLTGAAAKDTEDNDMDSEDNLLELAKTSRFYEQINHGDEIYKLGDFVYVRYQQLSANQPSTRDDLKLPLIVRIDRLWAPKTAGETNQYYLRGAVFLRPTDIPHEPTRLFYKNEVFKEMQRHITASLDEIVVSPFGSKQRKCIVMSARRYTTCRSTEINERDVYICEAKYALQTRTFRKFTKELKAFKLSSRCLEDEIYVLRRDLQLRKHLSPLLVSLDIDYDDQSADYLRDFNDPQTQLLEESTAAAAVDRDDSTRDGLDDDENSQMEMASPSQSTSIIAPSASIAERTPKSNKVSFLIENGVNSVPVNSSSSTSRIKKDRGNKPAKKSGFNIFSKEFRKSLRDTKSSLSFIDMSKEVGLRWRALSEKERAEYEHKAAVATQKEQEKFEAEQAVLAAQQRAEQEQQQKLAAAKMQQQQATPTMLTASGVVQSNMVATAMPQQATITLNGQPIYYQSGTGQQIIIQQPVQTGSGSPMIIQQLPNNLKPTQPYLIYPNQTAVQTAAPQQIQQQNLLPYDYPQQTAAVVNDGPKHPQHREAYMRYISNLKRAHQVQNSPAANNPIANAAQVHQSDWYTALDVRGEKIREKRVQAPSLAWIENCSSENVLQHLVSLRYHLLNDALNIRKGESDATESIVPSSDELPSPNADSAATPMVVE